MWLLIGGRTDNPLWPARKPTEHIEGQNMLVTHRYLATLELHIFRER